MVNDIINKLKDCDDFHNRCDCLLEHDEITYLLEYIEELQERIDEAIEYMPNLRRMSSYDKDEKIDDLLKILKGEDNNE